MGVRTLLLGTEGTDAIICSGMTSALFGMCALVCRTGGCVDESEAFAVLVAALKGAMVVCVLCWRPDVWRARWPLFYLGRSIDRFSGEVRRGKEACCK